MPGVGRTATQLPSCTCSRRPPPRSWDLRPGRHSWRWDSCTPGYNTPGHNSPGHTVCTFVLESGLLFHRPWQLLTIPSFLQESFSNLLHLAQEPGDTPITTSPSAPTPPPPLPLHCTDTTVTFKPAPFQPNGSGKVSRLPSLNVRS